MIIQIQIPRRRTKCTLKGEPILAGSEYHSFLFEEGEGVYRREDVCNECWKSGAAVVLADEAATHWQSKVPEKIDEDERSQNRAERALDSLKEGLESGGDEAQNFMLALYLQRRRRLILRQELEQGDATFLLYEVVGTEEMLPVRKVAAETLDVERLQDEINRLINE